MNRKGSAIAIAVIMGTVFFLAVSALLHHSSGELKHVKAISAVKKAELLALSGIDYAESQLRVERWYGTDFVPYKKSIGEHNSCGIEVLTPFGSGEGKVTVVCEDVANKTPGENMFGMQKIWFLHHINVYALGEYDNQKCLVYGRYIISPEPILNSKSTEGAGFASPEYGTPGAVPVTVTSSFVDRKNAIVPITDYIVKELKVFEGDKVDANTVVAILNPVNVTDHSIKVFPHTFGTVVDVKVQEGQTVKAGDNIVILKKTINSGGNDVSMRTLKKMVRITKIPPDIWQGLDIYNRNDRYTLSQYITGISDAFLQNFVAHPTLEKSIKSLGDKKLDKKITSAYVFEKFPLSYTSTTRERAENSFLAHMIKNFTAPGGTWEKKEEALNKTYLELDHPKTTKPPADLVNWLNELNLQHLLNTKPRLNNRYFDPKMKGDEFMNLINPHLNQSPDEFIKELSQLPDASRMITIEEGDFGDTYVNESDENHIKIIDPDKKIRVTVDKITKKYTFVDPVSNFAIEMNDLMAFIKKYYDDENCESPREEVRRNEHIDWPLPAPAPEPPAPKPGGTWVWHEGTPGTPPGDPKYIHNGGSDVNINPPTGGTSGFDPIIPGDLDGGSKDWEIPGYPGTDGKEIKIEDEEKNEEPSSIKLCNCNGDDCCICNPSSTKGKITMNKNTKWDVIPGTPGKDPEQGRYEWVPDPPKPEPGSDGSDGTPGSADGGSNGSDGQMPGDGGTPGSPGSGTPGSGPSTPTPPSTPPTPPTPPRYSSGCC